MLPRSKLKVSSLGIQVIVSDKTFYVKNTVTKRAQFQRKYTPITSHFLQEIAFLTNVAH